MKKEYLKVKILELGNYYDGVLATSNKVYLPKQVRLSGERNTDFIGYAKNFKIENEFIICDIIIEKEHKCKTIIPMLYYSSSKLRFDEVTLIKFNELDDDDKRVFKHLRNNLKGKEKITSWKARIMKV